MKKKATAFSLIELMIALSIIGLMMGLLLPKFGSIQQKAKENAVKQLAHSVQTAIESYQLSQGIYPKQATTFTALCSVLIEDGALSKLPKNPFTGNTYTNEDESGKMTYSFANNVYVLSAYGVNNQEIILELPQ